MTFRVEDYSRFIRRWFRFSIYTRGVTGTGTLHLVISLTLTPRVTWEAWRFLGRGPGRARTLFTLGA
jgi:hypothetical protein